MQGASQIGSLILDSQTCRDLEIFEADAGAPSLYDFCNRTRTDGGARVLQERMQQPFASTDDIQRTQAALIFIADNRSLFTPLESLAHATHRVEKYAHEILPVLPQKNTVEFALAAIALWANHDRHYASIMLGVQFAARLVRALRAFVRQTGFEHAGEELGAIIREMRTALDDTTLNLVPDEEPGSAWAIRTLRLDQVFRLSGSDALRELLRLIYALDALVAMADVSRDNQWTMPEVMDGPLAATGTLLTHPFVQEPVGNSLHISQQQRVIFLTGPNMAGKTTYLRSVATVLYLGHLGMAVPAESFSFSPADRLFSSISLSDDLRGGISYFRAEALRVKAIASAMAEGHRVVAIMDEPFKGTNVKDALDASLAILERFAKRQDCITLFSSHLIELNERMADKQQLNCLHFGANEDGERLQFDYRLKTGISDQRLGMRVLREEGIFDLLDEQGRENGAGDEIRTRDN